MRISRLDEPCSISLKDRSWLISYCRSTMRLIVRARSPSQPQAQSDPRSIVVAPTRVRVHSRIPRVLDFDCEARPLHWIGGDYVSKEITAMAWAWTDDPAHVTCYLLGETDTPIMLEAFRAAYDQADMVTGHYIRGFDLPLVNGAMTEYQLRPLNSKLCQDTKIDLLRRHGLSGSQESIGSMLNLTYPKIGMNQKRWRDANRLTRSGRETARTRVVGDVRQHIEMRARLLELGYLRSPRIWDSGTAQVESYTP